MGTTAGSEATWDGSAVTMPPKPREAKVVVLGDAGAGKTSVIQRFTQDSFDECTKATVGASFASKTVPSGDTGSNIKLSIWDTAGAEQFQSMAPIYYRNANAAIVIFDLLVWDSFVKAKFWIAQLKDNAPPGVKIQIVGNKADREIERKVPAETARSLANDIGAGYFETSAKSGAGVEELFHEIGIQVGNVSSAVATAAGNSTLDIGSGEDGGKKKGKCC